MFLLDLAHSYGARYDFDVDGNGGGDEQKENEKEKKNPLDVPSMVHRPNEKIIKDKDDMQQKVSKLKIGGLIKDGQIIDISTQKSATYIRRQLIDALSQIGGVSVAHGKKGDMFVAGKIHRKFETEVDLNRFVSNAINEVFSKSQHYESDELTTTLAQSGQITSKFCVYFSEKN